MPAYSKAWPLIVLFSNLDIDRESAKKRESAQSMLFTAIRDIHKPQSSE